MCPLTDVGRDHFATDLIGLSVTEFDNANAALGVGDSTTAFAKAQTDLQAGPNKLRKGMEAGFPDVPSAANILRFRALFGTSEANFAWEEWALFNALAAGTMLSRKVENLGTKTAAQSFQLTATITVNNP
jgi:hypothetical protein